jgi:hypothetical protein
MAFHREAMITPEQAMSFVMCSRIFVPGRAYTLAHGSYQGAHTPP